MITFKQIPEKHLDPSLWNTPLELIYFGVVTTEEELSQILAPAGQKLKTFNKVTRQVTDSVYNEFYLPVAKLTHEFNF